MSIPTAPALPSFPPTHPSFDIVTNTCDGSQTVTMLDKSIKVPPHEFSEKVLSIWDSLETESKLQVQVHDLQQLWDLLYCGALRIRSKCGFAITAVVLRTCCAWCDILELLSKKLRSTAALDLLLASWRIIIDIGPIPEVNYFGKICDAFEAHRRKYVATRMGTDFSETRLLAEKLVAVSETVPERVKAFTLRGQLYGMRIDDNLPDQGRNTVVRRSIEDLTAATELLDQIGRQQAHANIFNFLAFSLFKRFELAHRKEDIDAEIAYRNKALEYVPQGSNLWIGWADNLARAYWRKYDEYSQGEDVNAAISIFEEVLNANEQNPHASTGLAEMLRKRASARVISNSQRTIDFDRAVGLLERVIVNTPDGEQVMASRLGKCSSVLATRFTHDGVLNDIDIAIELQETAIPLSVSQVLWFHYKQLCEYYIYRFNHLEIGIDLERALAAGQRSVDEAGPSKKDQADSIFQLGCAQGTAYYRTKNVDMLSKAISSFTVADRLNTESLWRSVAVIENLAQALGIRYEIEDKAEDGAEAIKLAREAIDILRRLSGRGNHNREARCLGVLGEIYRKRVQKLSAKEDLDEAINAFRRCHDMTDNEDMAYVPRVKDFVHVLAIRYVFFGHKEDMKDAEALVETALDILNTRKVAPSTNDLALLINQKGILYLRRYAKDEERSHLSLAMEEFAHAAKINPSCETWAHNQAQAAVIRAVDFPTPSNYTDAMAALKRFQRKICTLRSFSTQDHLAVTQARARIGVAYIKDHLENKATHKYTLENLKKIVLSEKAAPGDKIWAAGEAAAYLSQHCDNISDAKSFINIGVRLLPHVTTLGLSKADQIRAYRDHANLPKLALAFNTMAGTSLNESVKIFERARSVLWNRILDQHVDLFEAENKVPELVKEFKKLQVRINSPRRPIATGDRVDGMAFAEPDQYKEVDDYLSVLRKIQAVPGLEDFPAAAYDDKNLIRYATYGPVVIVNCIPYYGHAVLVTKKGLFGLKLPDFDERLARLLHKKLQEAFALLRIEEQEGATTVYQTVLNTLWRRVAKPILDKLNAVGLHDEHMSKGLPRLWWITTGWVNMLPIHAAGESNNKQGNGKSCMLMDHVISSYIPNFRALGFARKNARERAASTEAFDSNTEAMLVSMPKTLNKPELPQAAAEISAIKPFLQASYNALNEIDRPSRLTALSALKTASHAHIICHGEVSNIDPTLSYLILHDSEIESRRFSVRSILSASMPRMRSLYLSACNTSVAGIMSLRDENLHVAGAFLMAGCAEVVASRWEVVDCAAPKVAEDYYRALAKDKGRGKDDAPGILGSARALHAATVKARDEGVNPMFWGTYVHYGA